MKKTYKIISILCIIFLLLTVGYILKKNHKNVQDPLFQDPAFSVTETYTSIPETIPSITLTFGTYYEENRYLLNREGIVTQGNFNYERGWKSDENATVYILNWDLPDNQQRIFVRKTGTNTLVELNHEREEITPKIVLLKH